MIEVLNHNQYQNSKIGNKIMSKRIKIKDNPDGTSEKYCKLCDKWYPVKKQENGTYTSEFFSINNKLKSKLFSYCKKCAMDIYKKYPTSRKAYQRRQRKNKSKSRLIIRTRYRVGNFVAMQHLPIEKFLKAFKDIRY